MGTTITKEQEDTLNDTDYFYILDDDMEWHISSEMITSSNKKSRKRTTFL